MIELDRVSKAYDGRTVVEALSLSVPEGAFCVLLGASGSGKSTILRMINRLVPADSGTIRVAGDDIS
ncbi:MAG TPA: ATP-binding cassette domain-containing protein, partial [Stellaceae bacterium]|nr:ATP-binding cassette domain-containing protein [Stellaceae bacterium]